MAFAYYSPFTVQAGMVPSQQADFPVLLLPTDNRFRTVANGGHVENASGYDLRSYADISLSTALDFELVPGTYDPTSGFFEKHVRFPLLDDGDIIYEAYGDAALNTDGSSTLTWESSLKGVYHLPNGSSLTVDDSTSNANDGTLVNSPAAAAGQIDGGAAFVAVSSRSIQAGNPVIGGTAQLTASVWYKGTGVSQEISGIDHSPGQYLFDMYVSAAGKFIFFVNGASNPVRVSATTVNDNAWHYLVGVFNGGTGALDVYVDGALDNGSLVGSVPATLSATSGPFWMSGYDVGGTITQPLDGTLDEHRLSATARTADYIEAAYNNESDPNVFYTLGPEAPVVVSESLFRYVLLAGLGSGGSFFQNPLN